MMEIQNCNYRLFKCTTLLLLLCTNLVSAQEYDCKRFCSADCMEYLWKPGLSEMEDYYSCKSAKGHCNCGLPWYAILMIVIFSWIFGLVCCCGIVRGWSYFKCDQGVQSFPVRRRNMFNYALNSATNSMPTRVHATIANPPQLSTNYTDSADQRRIIQEYLNTNFGQAQPSFNPAFLENPTAPSFQEVNNGPDLQQFDALPTYEEAVRSESRKTNGT